MSISFGAYNSALRGMKVQQASFDRAANKLVESTLADATPAIEPTQSAGGGAGAQQSQLADDPGLMTEAMVEMMTAHNAFTASLRVLETADDMLKEAIKLLE